MNLTIDLDFVQTEEEIKKLYFLTILELEGYNQTRCAEALGLHRRTLIHRIAKYRKQGAVIPDFVLGRPPELTEEEDIDRRINEAGLKQR